MSAALAAMIPLRQGRRQRNPLPGYPARVLLVPNVLPYDGLVEPDGADKVASGPERSVATGPVPPLRVAARQDERALPLEVAHRLGHRQLRSDPQAHVHVVARNRPLATTFAVTQAGATSLWLLSPATLYQTW